MTENKVRLASKPIPVLRFDYPDKDLKGPCDVIQSDRHYYDILTGEVLLSVYVSEYTDGEDTWLVEGPNQSKLGNSRYPFKAYEIAEKELMRLGYMVNIPRTCEVIQISEDSREYRDFNTKELLFKVGAVCACRDNYFIHGVNACATHRKNMLESSILVEYLLSVLGYDRVLRDQICSEGFRDKRQYTREKIINPYFDDFRQWCYQSGPDETLFMVSNPRREGYFGVKSGTSTVGKFSTFYDAHAAVTAALASMEYHTTQSEPEKRYIVRSFDDITFYDDDETGLHLFSVNDIGNSDYKISNMGDVDVLTVPEVVTCHGDIGFYMKSRLANMDYKEKVIAVNVEKKCTCECEYECGCVGEKVGEKEKTQDERETNRYVTKRMDYRAVSRKTIDPSQIENESRVGSDKEAMISNDERVKLLVDDILEEHKGQLDSDEVDGIKKLALIFVEALGEYAHRCARKNWLAACGLDNPDQMTVKIIIDKETTIKSTNTTHDSHELKCL